MLTHVSYWVHVLHAYMSLRESFDKKKGVIKSNEKLLTRRVLHTQPLF